MKKSNGVNYSELVYKTKSTIYTDTGVYKKIICFFKSI